MNTYEFSDKFDVLLNSYASEAEFGDNASRLNLVVDEYEKSLFLTEEQKDFVYSYYSGKNPSDFSFEEKEEIREALDVLVRTLVYNSSDQVEEASGLSSELHVLDNKTKTFFRIPDNLLYIVFEEVKFSSYLSGCKNGQTALVVPATHDELWHRLQNPFRGTSGKRVLRLNTSKNLVELISDYPIGSYLLRYVEEPKPIILTDLPDGLSIEGVSERTECVLPSFVHTQILEGAVKRAIQTKLINLTRQEKSRQ